MRMTIFCDYTFVLFIYFLPRGDCFIKLEILETGAMYDNTANRLDKRTSIESFMMVDNDVK